MKIITKIIICIGLVLCGFVLGTSLPPFGIYFTPHSMVMQTAVVSDDITSENLRCDIDDIEYLTGKIDEHDLDWTHLHIMDGHVGFFIYEFRPWGSKRFEEKIKLTETILKECKQQKYSNQKMESTR